MNVQILLFTNVALLVVNVLTVMGNIYLPRLLERPNLEIVAVNALVDEDEIEFPNSVSRVLTAVLEIRRDGDNFYANRSCYTALEEHSFVPRACVSPLSETLKEILSNSQAERATKIAALSEIDDFDEEKLVAALELSAPLGYVSTFYNDVLLNILAAENIAKDEIAAPMRDALVVAAIGLVEREFRYIETVEQAIEIMEDNASIGGGGSRIVLEVAILNSGHSADLLGPNGRVFLASRNILVSRISREELSDESLANSSQHVAIPEGSAITTYFLVDEMLNTVEVNEVVQTVFSDLPSIQFELELEGSNGLIKSQGTVEPQVISFESTFD